jgi:hypothetical protein
METREKVLCEKTLKDNAKNQKKESTREKNLQYVN